ncbi:MAG: hypothetical protein IJ132_05995 [Firmicutes bacterium]|nr:hypothetical protein [Bacillota bacterium]
MSLTEGSGGLSAADVAAVTGGFGNNNGFFNGDGAWWLIILLLFANNGWGGGFGFGGGGMMPWMMGTQTTQNDVQRGFDQSAIMGSLNGITSALSNGFANAEISRCNGNTNVLQALNTNQAAVVSGMNSLAMSLQNCCCENRAGVADLKYTVATENCADRAAVSDGIRDLMAANTANTQALVNSTNAGFQSIMDKICQLELDGKNQTITNLQAQLNEANRRASQNDQTAQILASQAAQTAALEQYLRPGPSPAYIVQNPNCCPQTFGCGCAA